jgi:hypothetical protein
MRIITFLTLILSSLFLQSQNWSEPVVIYNEGNNYNHSFAIDNNGNIHCVWSHEVSGGFHKIYYSSSDDEGQTWSAPTDITQNTSLRLDEPQIAVDTNNILYVTYTYDLVNMSNNMIRIQTYDGISWSEPQEVSEGMQGSYKSRLVMDKTNILYCFWYYPVDGGKIYYRRFENNTWSQIYQPYSTPGDNFYFEMAKVDSQNILHCVGTHFYYGQSGFDNKVIYFTYNNTWSDFTEISSDQLRYSPSIDLTSLDQPVIEWGQKITGVIGSSGIFITVFENGSWTPPEFIGDSSWGSTFAIDCNDSYNIIKVERVTPWYYYLTYYYQEDTVWKKTILESNENSYNPRLLAKGSILYFIYIRAESKDNVNSSTSILFRKKDVVSKIKDDKFVEALKVYPNPFTDFAIIEFNLPQVISMKIEVFNFYGELINSVPLNNMVTGINRYCITKEENNWKSLASGIYLLRLSSENHSISYTKKIIVK